MKQIKQHVDVIIMWNHIDHFYYSTHTDLDTLAVDAHIKKPNCLLEDSDKP